MGNNTRIASGMQPSNADASIRCLQLLIEGGKKEIKEIAVIKGMPYQTLIGQCLADRVFQEKKLLAQSKGSSKT